jgi:hypothetical protein
VFVSASSMSGSLQLASLDTSVLNLPVTKVTKMFELRCVAAPVYRLERELLVPTLNLPSWPIIPM